MKAFKERKVISYKKLDGGVCSEQPNTVEMIIPYNERHAFTLRQYKKGFPLWGYIGLENVTLVSNCQQNNVSGILVVLIL